MNNILNQSLLRFNKEREKMGMAPVSRREFMRVSSVVAVGLAIPFEYSCSMKGKTTFGSAGAAEVVGRINHDTDRCVGCGVCGLMCSLHHYGEQGPSLSRSELVRKPLTYDHSLYVCQQ
ncbi:MAG: hypothetical protein GY866_26150 [Proteobacteria bacterium]|nr:hypothetical protein [Pseudomonadota bacterium]